MMDSRDMITWQISNDKVRIEAGELLGYEVKGHEFIHQKGSAGWRNSDTEMFPVIGPTADAGFRVQVSKGNAIQDQHGLLRELDYELVSEKSGNAVFKKIYKAGTLVRNSKFPDKSTAEWLIWPYDFEFYKTFDLNSTGLHLRFTVSGERDMPYMLGYHPAFQLYTEDPKIIAPGRIIGLPEVLKAGSRALQVPDCHSLVLRDKRELEIVTRGFAQFMLWTEVPTMVCIEPITFYPYSVPQYQLHEGFQHLRDSTSEYEVSLLPIPF